jgi:aminoglycoside phosphotransferase (APT) family kinase protein
MLPGFIKIDRHRFYADAWPRISNRVEAIDSNWKEVHECLKANQPAPDLRICWGHKDKATGHKVALAFSCAKPGTDEEHWIAREVAE